MGETAMTILLRTTVISLAIGLILLLPHRAAAQNVVGPASQSIYACVDALGLVTWQTTTCPNNALTKPAQAAGSTWSAQISATGAILSGSDWIQSVTHSTAGIYVLNFVSAFPTTPSCEGTIDAPNFTTNPGGDDAFQIAIPTVTSTNATINTVGFTNGPAVHAAMYDNPFTIACQLVQ
jgi:hypothetical protein